MPQLQWSDNEFALCLEVMPEVEEYKTKYIYKVEKDGLVLTVTVWQYESVVGLCLRAPNVDVPAVEFVLYVRGPALYVDEKWGEYIRLEDCVITPGRFFYIDAGELWDNVKFPHGYSVSIAVQPHIRIRHDYN